RRQAGEVRRRPRLQVGIVDEGDAGLVRFRKIEFGGRDRLDPVRTEQFADFPYLAFIVAGDDQLAGQQLVGHRPVALSCAAKMSAQPMRARRSRRSSPSSSNT